MKFKFVFFKAYVKKMNIFIEIVTFIILLFKNIKYNQQVH